MGKLPDWFRLIEAARYLGVPPWDLANKPVFWQEAALVAKDSIAWAVQQQNGG